MSLVLHLINITISIMAINENNVGLASVYDDKVFACPRSSYASTHLPTLANRSLPCGSVVNVMRLDTGKVVRSVVIDKGPFGACFPSPHSHTRACGNGKKWVNGRNYFKHNIPMITGNWRGIIDMSPKLAHMLGTKNGLIPVFISLETNNNALSGVSNDDLTDNISSRGSANDADQTTSLKSDWALEEDTPDRAALEDTFSDLRQPKRNECWERNCPSRY